MAYEYNHNSNDYNRDFEITIRQLEKENTIGCLISGIIMLCLLFIFFALLPFFLTVIGFLIIILVCITIYKAYLEHYVLNFIQKHNLRR